MSHSAFTIDVEEYFNILDTDSAPPIESWSALESRLPENMDVLLQLLEQHDVKATFFWLGYFADRYPKLVQRCSDAGHEIASHGYSHLLFYQTPAEVYREDIYRAKSQLEEISGKPVVGYRAAGFSVTDQTEQFFDMLSECGYRYDTSIFPAARAHGGIKNASMSPYIVSTAHGQIVEIPASTVEFAGQRLSLFGGGYLRLFPWWLIRYGIDKLKKEDVPFVLYIHPREIDPGHPRLKLPMWRSFKCYVNLDCTEKKLSQCLDYVNDFRPLQEIAADILNSSPAAENHQPQNI